MVKLHPEERQDKYEIIQGSYDQRELIVVKECNTETLLEKADFVVGMGSMLLIEAAKTRKDVISYRPNEKMTFIGNQMGVTKLISDRGDLTSVIRGNMTVSNDLVGSRFRGSMEKILSAVNEFIEMHNR